MKKIIILVNVLICSITPYFVKAQALAQGPLISGIAPAFKAISTTGTINFPEDYYGKWKIIFSHPADFTPVCTSELLSLAKNQDKFKKLNTSLIVVSTDGLNSHIEWIKSIEDILSDSVTKFKINFPIIADNDLKVSKLYGILKSDSTTQKDIRGIFIIDPENKIRAFFAYPETVGRNIEEIKRTLIALQTEYDNNVLMPANWQPGDEVLIHSPKTTDDAEKLEAKKDTKLRKVTWYMWYKKL